MVQNWQKTDARGGSVPDRVLLLHKHDRDFGIYASFHRISLPRCEIFGEIEADF
jgi:hypothetical protein